MIKEWDSDPLLNQSLFYYPGEPEGASSEEPVEDEQNTEDNSAVELADSVRQTIMERFEHWLDEVMESEEPPQGYEADVLAELIVTEANNAHKPAADENDDALGAPDSYTMWATLSWLQAQTITQVEMAQSAKEHGDSALKQSVGKLTDTVKSLKEIPTKVTETLQPESEVLAKSIAQLKGCLGSEREERLKMEGQARAWEQILDLLIDMRDRLLSGYQKAKILQQQEMDSPTGKRWSGRIFAGDSDKAGGTVGHALVKGYRMTLDRLEEAFEEFGIKEIESMSQPYDSEKMKAVDIEETTEAADGAVLKVYQAGYEWNGSVARKAHVLVARNSA